MPSFSSFDLFNCLSNASTKLQKKLNSASEVCADMTTYVTFVCFFFSNIISLFITFIAVILDNCRTLVIIIYRKQLSYLKQEFVTSYHLRYFQPLALLSFEVIYLYSVSHVPVYV